MHELSVLCGQETYVLRLGVWGLTCMLAFWSSDAQRTRSAMLIIWCVSLCNWFYAFGLPPFLGFWLHPAQGYLTTFPVVELSCGGPSDFEAEHHAQYKKLVLCIFWKVAGKGWLWN